MTLNSKFQVQLPRFCPRGITSPPWRLDKGMPTLELAGKKFKPNNEFIIKGIPLEVPLECICEELLAKNMKLENIKRMHSKCKPSWILQHVSINGVLETANLPRTKLLLSYGIRIRLWLPWIEASRSRLDLCCRYSWLIVISPTFQVLRQQGFSNWRWMEMNPLNPTCWRITIARESWSLACKLTYFTENWLAWINYKQSIAD